MTRADACVVVAHILLADGFTPEEVRSWPSPSSAGEVADAMDALQAAGGLERHLRLVRQLRSCRTGQAVLANFLTNTPGRHQTQLQVQ